MTTEVAIHGLTCAGLAAAWTLARAGVKVALLGEPLPLPLGVALPATPEHFWVMAEGVGAAQAALWWRLACDGAAQVREILAEMGVPHRTGGLLQLAVNDIELLEMSRSLGLMAAAGLTVRMMSAGSASNYVTLDECEGALWLPGVTLFDERTAVPAMLEALERAGVTRPSGPVECDVDIHTTDVLKANQMNGRVCDFAPFGDVPRSGVVAVTANRCHELYVCNDERLSVAALDPSGSEANELVFDARVRQIATQRFPEVADAKAAGSRAFPTVQSPDGIPLLGTLPGPPQRFVAAAFGMGEWGWGFGAGTLLARSVLGDQTELSQLSSGSPRRFAAKD